MAATRYLQRLLFRYLFRQGGFTMALGKFTHMVCEKA